jgi:ABC-type branched-subunit amino acid transport system substrate-binding protein
LGALGFSFNSSSPESAVRPLVRFACIALFALVSACAEKAAPPPSPPPVAQAKPVPTPGKPAPPLPSLPGLPAGPVTPQVAPAGGTLVGIVLPLSGPSATIGNAMLNAAQMALFELAGPDLTLLPFDSAGTAEGATDAVRQAIGQHVDIIVGPVFATEARAVTPIAEAAHVPVLSLSADQSVAGHGTYVMGFLPGLQAVRIAQYAASQGKMRQAVLAPSNDYGRRVVAALTNGVAGSGVILGPIEYYDPAALDLSASLKRLLANRKDDDAGFDALLLPDDGQRLRRTGEQWAAQGVPPDRVTLLGTMLWDDAHPGDIPSLAGGWYAMAPAAGYAEFAKRYAKAFGGQPPRLASLAYDATAIAAVLGKRSAHDFSPGILTNPQGFAGVDGLFRLNLDGTNTRAYAIKEVVPNGQPKEIVPAAKSFEG